MFADGWELCQTWVGRGLLLAAGVVLCVSYLRLAVPCLLAECRRGE